MKILIQQILDPFERFNAEVEVEVLPRAGELIFLPGDVQKNQVWRVESVVWNWKDGKLVPEILVRKAGLTK